MTYAALIEDQTRPTASSGGDPESRKRRQSDKTDAAKNGRRWSDHVEIELVGSDDNHATDQSFVTTAFAAQVLGQFTHRPSAPKQGTHQGQVYQLNQEISAAGRSGNPDRVLA